MKVIIAGTRSHSLEPDKMQELVDKSGLEVTELVCGMAKGVDISAKFWALEKGIPYKKFHPDWATMGKSAGHERNRRMAEYADALIAIWDGQSKGTANMIQTMQSLNKKIVIFRYSP